MTTGRLYYTFPVDDAFPTLRVGRTYVARSEPFQDVYVSPAACCTHFNTGPYRFLSKTSYTPPFPLLEVTLGADVTNNGVEAFSREMVVVREVPPGEVASRVAGEHHFVWPDGTEQWYKNGALQRDGDLPAIVWADGTMEWYCRGRLVREVAADGTVHFP